MDSKVSVYLRIWRYENLDKNLLLNLLIYYLLNKAYPKLN